jgi:hypothetical protein
MERPLLEWFCKLGIAEADRYSNQAAQYGSLMHRMFGKYLIQKSFDLSIESIKEEVTLFCNETEYWEREVEGWPKKLQEDMLAFAAFIQENNVVPLAIEFVLVSERGFGTLIDLVCEMDCEIKGFYGEEYKSGPRKGQPKETTQVFRKIALINFKSGRHSFYRTNGLQVEAEKILFEENFPDIKIDYAFNWSPKDWNTTPSYNLKNWVGEIDKEEIDAVLKLAEIRFGRKAQGKSYLKVEGTITTERDSMERVLRFISAEDYAKEKYGTIPVE